MPSMQNPHSDILKAEIPDEDGKRTQLLEELKSRAKGAFQCKDLLNAEALYTRAIDCTDKDHLLYSNRAAVRLLLKKNDGALRDTDRCLRIEPAFLKAHYRKAQALHRLLKFKDGIDACKSALEKHPDNAEIKNLQKDIQTDWEKDIEDKKKFNAEAKEVKPDMKKPEPTRIIVDPKKEKENNAKSTTSTKAAGSEEAKLRGYKKTADGKTTSYFHTDIDDEAKRLIAEAGFGKPQKLDPTALEAEKKPATGSAWNTAGTFEEKNFTKWFQDKVRAGIPSDTLVDLPNELPCIQLTLDSVYGDANIACTRGKVKYIHDISCDIKWKFETQDGKKGEGTAKFENDGDGDYDIVVEVDSKTHSQVRSIVTQFVKSSASGMQPFVLDVLKKAEKEFQAVKLG